MTDQYPDPLNEALVRTGERSVQILSLATYAGQAAMRIAAELREKRASRRAIKLRELELERQRARLAWAPAHDPKWLAQADILQTARVWGAALPYSDRETRQYDPTAESAMHKCEDRLRTLHPHAMARYDRLRADDWEPAAAMREAAPFFDRPPNVAEAGPVPSPVGALRMAPPGTIPERGATYTTFEHGPDKEEFLAVRRAGHIIDRLNATARGQGRPPLGRGDLRTVLDSMTNLPPDVIDRVTAAIPDAVRAGDIGLGHSMAQRATAAEQARAADLNTATDNPATRLVDERTDQLRDTARQAATASAYKTFAGSKAANVAAQDFPFTIQQVVDAAEPAPTPEPNRSPTAKTSPAHRIHNGRNGRR